MDEKEQLNQADIGAAAEGDEDREPPVFDIDAGTGGDALAPEDEDEAPGDDSAGPQEGREPGSRASRRVSRKEILDRFQEKNEVIARLTREKNRLDKENADLAEQAREHKDRWLRAAAEFENYRKRSSREWELLKQQSKSEVILEVLNSLDDFERAFAVVAGTDDSEFVQGIRLIYNNLLSGLQKLGVSEFQALHQPFDPNVHMAVGQIETDAAPSGHVVEVLEKGYSLNGVLIRPARVIVAK
jgi:molecular chaperone GrpE